MAQTGPGIGARVAAGLRLAVTGRLPDWFGPGTAPGVMATPEPRGRQFDYPVGYNLRIQPRQDDGIGFADLRALADSSDLLRLVIETRKDQLEKISWSIKPCRPRAGQPSAAPDDPRLDWLEALLRFPDREHGWAGWTRMLLEDLFVLDAPCLYVRRDRSGGLYGLEVVDGATIKRVLDEDGRTPRPPDVAYQQILKGVPASDYTADELIYAPRNPRSHRVYGYSPVEQIVMTVNIALRRQAGQLGYFTEGNTPEALIGVPDAWSPDQIRDFQQYWDALLEGNMAARRHTRFVPGGLKYQATREPPLKDEFDEWLARVICFAFSIPPTALVRQTNRATAETQQEAALAEGLSPLLAWLKGLIDRVILRQLGWADIEFVWSDEVAPDPLRQAQVAAQYVGAGIKTRNEARAALGLTPLPDGDTLTVAGPVTPLARALAPPTGIAKAGFDPAQPRNDNGRWTGNGAGGAGANATPGGEQLAQVFFGEMPPIIDPVESPATTELPSNPDELLKRGYRETTHPDIPPDGTRTFKNDKTGDELRFDKGEDGENGWQGEDHYHRMNPDKTQKKAPYLDKDGNPTKKGSRGSHLRPVLPGDIA